MMNILITGATGFLGKHIVPKLIKEGYHCKLLVRDLEKAKNIFNNSDQIEYVLGDMTDLDFLKKISESENPKINCLIHLAALLGDWHNSKEKIIAVNSLGTRDLLRQMPSIDHFIFCSTPGVLGFGHKNADESLPYNPNGSYEISKVEAEIDVQTVCESKNIKWTIIRPDFVYGPEDFRRIPLYRRIQNNKMYLLGRGQSCLSPTYVEDVAEAFSQCIKNPKAENNIFHISGDTITVSELFHTIAFLLNKPFPKLKIPIFVCKILALFSEHVLNKLLKKPPLITGNRIDFLTKHHSVSHDKASRLLGYIPSFTINEGMEKTLSWCKKENLL